MLAFVNVNLLLAREGPWGMFIFYFMYLFAYWMSFTPHSRCHWKIFGKYQFIVAKRGDGQTWSSPRVCLWKRCLGVLMGAAHSPLPWRGLCLRPQHRARSSRRLWGGRSDLGSVYGGGNGGL